MVLVQDPTFPDFLLRRNVSVLGALLRPLQLMAAGNPETFVLTAPVIQNTLPDTQTYMYINNISTYIRRHGNPELGKFPGSDPELEKISFVRPGIFRCFDSKLGHLPSSEFCQKIFVRKTFLHFFLLRLVKS